MRSRLIGGLAAVFLLGSGPAQAQAPIPLVTPGSPVFCTNCTNQVWEAIQWVQHFQNQIQQITYAINFWETLLINTASMPFRLMNDITSPIREVQGLVERANLIQGQAKFMIENLSAPTGYGGSLEDIPRALAQESNALAMAMNQLGLVNQRVQSMSTQCSAQFASVADGNFGAAGIKSAVQGGTEMSATAGQCAQLRLQLDAARANATATAQLREADRQQMIDTHSRLMVQESVVASCAAITGTRPWVCAQ